VGIDIDQKNLVVCLGRLSTQGQQELYAEKTFANSPKGFKALVGWVDGRTNPAVSVGYAMEATGVYYESLAYYLSELGLALSVIKPNKIAAYAQSLPAKGSNDVLAAQAIARYGLQTTLAPWKAPKPEYRQLKALTRERDQLVAETTAAKNQLHAYQNQGQLSPQSIARAQQRIQLLQDQQRQVEKQIAEVCKQSAELTQAVGYITSIPGIGLTTASIILAETQGFSQITSRRQLASYAGLDVMQKTSGSSVWTKPKISKKGNKYLRKALYMPSLSSAKHAPEQARLYKRLLAKYAIPKKAGVAVQRKMLELAYTLVKNKSMYDPHYHQKKMEQTLSVCSTEAS
jgi:transposase